MAQYPKPVTLPRWAETAAGVAATNIVTPTSGQQDTGWTVGQAPPSSIENFLKRYTYDWIKYLRDAGFTATSGSGFDGVTGTGDPAGNQNGVRGYGTGLGYGVYGTGSASSGSPGVVGVAAAGTNGDGIVGNGAGAGHGATFVAGSSNNATSAGAINLYPQIGLSAGTGKGCFAGDIAFNGTGFLFCATAGTWIALTLP